MAYFVGGTGNDTFVGDAENDTAVGGDGADVLDGGAGNDILMSSGLPESGVFVNYYAVSLDRGTASDTLIGGDGDDVLSAGYGDNVDGGAGDFDKLIISFQGASSGVVLDLTLTSQVVGGAVIQNIERVPWAEGSEYNDTLIGGPVSPEALYGRGGDDRLMAADYTDTVDGGDGNDTVDGRGSEYIRLLAGGAGDDIIYADGNLGDIEGGDGNDTIYATSATWAGAGNDTVVMSVSTLGWVIFGGDGNDDLTTSASGQFLAGDTGDDILRGGTAGDLLYGGTGNDTVNGGQGNDTLMGGADNDTVDGGDGVDIASFAYAGGGVTVSLLLQDQVQNTVGDGMDYLSHMEGLTGSDYADRLTGDAFDNSIRGGLGDDTLAGGNGFDTASYAWGLAGAKVSLLLQGQMQATGGAGTDYLSGFEALTGGIYADRLTGDGGANRLDGSYDNDTLMGGAGADSLVGGDGNDLLNGGTGADLMIGGQGNDTYQLGVGDTIFEDANAGIDKVLSALDSYTLGVTLENVTLIGTALNANGNGLNNIMHGNGLANTLQGGNGNDTIDGKAGNDTLNGGSGADNLHGGLGEDVFVYRALADSAVAAMDFIDDMIGVDRFDFHLIDANVHVAGDQAFTVVGAFKHHPTELVLSYNAVSDRTTVMLDVDGDAKADMAILLAGHITSTVGWLL